MACSFEVVAMAIAMTIMVAMTVVVEWDDGLMRFMVVVMVMVVTAKS